MFKPMHSARNRSSLITLIAVAIIVFSLSPGLSQAGSINPEAQEPKYEMGTFYLVLLIKPSNGAVPQAMPNQQLLGEHLKHVRGLLTSGKAAIAGPFLDDSRIAGVFVLNASSPEEARTIEEADPLVKSGGFSVEVLKWWAGKGVMKSQPPTKMATYYIAFLKRGPKWTAQRSPETEKLQADHMANINSMARSGKLVIAGPFENAGDYAGLFVFKVGSLDEAKALADMDPTIKAGRLISEVHSWHVPEGSLP